MPSQQIKVLFITQKVDKDDNVLGSYHHWIKELSFKVDSVSVICLFRGQVELPVNANVYSLGKEIGTLKLGYAWNFYKYIWRLRKTYDVVLVHMNPVYVVLGSVLWHLWNKPTFMWYNHPQGNFLAVAGIYLSKKVFCASSFSFAAKFSNAQIMPVGVDIGIFNKNPGGIKIKNSILYLGRISPIKKIERLIKSAWILDSRGLDFTMLIVGNIASEADKAYLDKIRNLAGDLVSREKIKFQPGIANKETPSIYNHNEIFVNLTPTGSFDKTIIEAMACETLVLVSNKVLESFFSENLKEACLFEEGNIQQLADKLSHLLSLSESLKEDYRRELRAIVVKNHSLSILMERLVSQFITATV